MNRFRWIVPIAVLIAMVSCNPPKPCTTCPNVAGMYTETTTAEAVTQSSCGTFGATSMTDMLTVVQPDGGSSVQIMPSGITGTLNADNSVTFAAASATTSDGQAESVSLSGSFTITSNVATGFQGQYALDLTTSGCTLNVPTAWTK